MENTANLSLPYIMPSQAQKHVTHNEALRALDAIVQLAVLDRDLAVAPASPMEGDRYIVASQASGAWEGRDGAIAAWQDGGWTFLAPGTGWLCFIIDEAALVHWTGTEWQDMTTTPPALQDLPLLGVGTSADIENPFAAKLNKALWAARTTGEGGSGDLRYTLNKQGASNILSLLMQSGWSGRAEIGLIGGDDLSVKVSADGTTWSEALTVDRANGKVAFPHTNVLTDFAVSLLYDSGRFAGSTARDIMVGAFAFPSYLSLTGSATASDGGKFITDNGDYGGAAGTLPAQVKALVDSIRAPTMRRYGVEFRIAEIKAGSTTGSVITVGGVSYYLSLLMGFGPRAPRMTFHCYIRALDATIAWRWYAGQTIVKNGVAYNAHVPITIAEGWVSVTVLDEQDPYASYGYNPTPLNIHTAATGHRFLMACPALMGGITQVDDNVGVVAGVNRWLG